MGVEVLLEDVDAALGLLADASLRPRFDTHAFDGLRGRHASWVRMALDEPDRIARELGPRVWLADMAPAYAAAIEGVPAQIEALTLEDVRADTNVPTGPTGPSCSWRVTSKSTERARLRRSTSVPGGGTLGPRRSDASPSVSGSPTAFGACCW